jgi:hypothetical protein
MAETGNLFHFDHKDEKLQDTYDMCVYTIYVQYIAWNEFAKWLSSSYALSPVNSHINFMRSAKGGHSKYIMQLILSHWYFEFHLNVFAR